MCISGKGKGEAVSASFTALFSVQNRDAREGQTTKYKVELVVEGRRVVSSSAPQSSQ